MIIPEELTMQLEKLITILNKCGLILSKDKFRYNEDQVELVNSLKFEFEELASIKIDTFLANVKNSNLERSILNGFIAKLTDYISTYESKLYEIEKYDKSILIKRILSQYQFGEKVKILEDDIADIEDERNGMPKWLKEKECDLLRNELENIKSIREKSFDKLSYIKKDYYSSIFLTCLEIENKIDAYFPSKNLEMQSDFFKREFISNYPTFIENDFNFNPKINENIADEYICKVLYDLLEDLVASEFSLQTLRELIEMKYEEKLKIKSKLKGKFYHVIKEMRQFFIKNENSVEVWEKYIIGIFDTTYSTYSNKKDYNLDEEFIKLVAERVKFLKEILATFRWAKI